jgi:hypothetical protein
MKTITMKDIYNTLKELSNGFKKPIDNQEALLQLKEDLELTINAEALKGLSSKQRITKCLNYAKKIGAKKPILGHACSDQLKDENGEPLQVFTDSFFMVALVKEDALPLKEYTELDGAQYPRLNCLIRNTFDFNIKIKVSDILNKLKLNDYILLNDYIKDRELAVNVALGKEETKRALEFLNVKNDENITVKFNNGHVPVRFERENGSWSIICQIKID